MIKFLAIVFLLASLATACGKSDVVGKWSQDGAECLRVPAECKVNGVSFPCKILLCGDTIRSLVNKQVPEAGPY